MQTLPSQADAHLIQTCSNTGSLGHSSQALPKDHPVLSVSPGQRHKSRRNCIKLLCDLLKTQHDIYVTPSFTDHWSPSTADRARFELGTGSRKFIERFGSEFIRVWVCRLRACSPVEFSSARSSRDHVDVPFRRSTSGRETTRTIPGRHVDATADSRAWPGFVTCVVTRL